MLSDKQRNTCGQVSQEEEKDRLDLKRQCYESFQYASFAQLNGLGAQACMHVTEEQTNLLSNYI